MKKFDVLVIGLNKASLATATLCSIGGLSVLCVDEEDLIQSNLVDSLPSSCMGALENMELLNELEKQGALYKNGTAFTHKYKYKYFNFFEKFTKGYGTSYHIKTSEFDKVLFQNAQKQGVDVRVKTEIKSLDFKKDDVHVTIKDKKGETKVKVKFVLDGSSKVLEKMQKITKHISIPKNVAYFADVKLKNTGTFFDEKKVIISTHPKKPSIWYWLEPFQNGVASLGVCGSSDELKVKGLNKNDNRKILKHFFDESIILKDFLKNSVIDKDAFYVESKFQIPTKLYGNKYAFLANGDQLLSPVFASGSCISFYSAQLAAFATIKTLRGKKCDFEEEYEEPLLHAIDTFKTYDESWQNGLIKDVIFAKNMDDNIERMICSILGGYIYDRKNPYVNKSKARLKALANSSKL